MRLHFGGLQRCCCCEEIQEQHVHARFVSRLQFDLAPQLATCDILKVNYAIFYRPVNLRIAICQCYMTFGYT